MSFAEAQLLVGAPTLALSWEPADPEAAAALLPSGLEAAPGAPVFLNQYTVPRGATSLVAGPQGSEPFTVTHMGVQLAGREDRSGLLERCWTDYLTDDEALAALAGRDGAPVGSGTTTLVREDDLVRCASAREGTELIRTEARFDPGRTEVLAGHARYLGAANGTRTAYPYAARAHPVVSATVEFRAPRDRSWALRPRQPFEPLFAYFAPAMSFAFGPAER